MSVKTPTIVVPLDRDDFKPYLLRALLEWCEDQQYTPYAMVSVDDSVDVPAEFINPDNSIVLCLSQEATDSLSVDDEAISFRARFNGAIHRVRVPLGRIAAVYPKENIDLVSYFSVVDTPAQSHSDDKKDDDDDIPTFTKLD